MSIVDDLKDSIDRSSNSDRSRDQRSGNSLDSSDPFESLGSDNPPQRNSERDQPSEMQNQTGFNDNRQRGGKRGQPGKQGRKRSKSSQQRPSSRRAEHPNAQAGRPQQGSSQPQLSSETRREMEHAGLNSNQGSRRESVADQRNDFEELKSQNQQIIELLKRINRNLEQLGR